MNKFREFLSPIEANDWILSNYKDFIIENQTNAHLENTLGYALFCYTGSMSRCYNKYLLLSHGNINEVVVDNEYSFEDTLPNMKLISNAFSQNQLKEDCILYHYIRNTKKNILEYVNKNNGIFEINSFFSTTLIRNSEGMNRLISDKRYNLLFKIRANKGINCIPILWNRKQSILQEFEVILEPKQKLKFIRARRLFLSKIKYILEFETV